MEHAELDDDGYPTEATLDQIAGWSYHDSYEDLFAFVREAYSFYGAIQGPLDAPPEKFRTWCENRIQIGSGRLWYYLATGGWSGNESIMDALKRNTIFWTTCWEASIRGGGFLFSVPRIMTNFSDSLKNT